MTGVRIATVPVCNRCERANSSDDGICFYCHGSVSYSEFPKRVVVWK
jgi:RNA polymerase subunit RPABC4/transcription elongation factor Spt4